MGTNCVWNVNELALGSQNGAGGWEGGTWEYVNGICCPTANGTGGSVLPVAGGNCLGWVIGDIEDIEDIKDNEDIGEMLESQGIITDVEKESGGGGDKGEPKNMVEPGLD